MTAGISKKTTASLFSVHFPKPFQGAEMNALHSPVTQYGSRHIYSATLRPFSIFPPSLYPTNHHLLFYCCYLPLPLFWYCSLASMPLPTILSPCTTRAILPNSGAKWNTQRRGSTCCRPNPLRIYERARGTPSARAHQKQSNSRACLRPYVST